MRPGHRAADRDAQRIAKRADRYAVRLVSPPGQRRHRPGRHRLSVDREGRRLALAPAEPCRADRQAGRAPARAISCSTSISARRQTRLPIRRLPMRCKRPAARSCCRRSSNWWRTATAAGRIHVNRPLPQFEQHAWSAIVNVAVEPDGLVRRYSFGEYAGRKVPAVGRRAAGGQVREQGSAAPDRLQHSHRLVADGLLCRCAARRSRRAEPPQGQESHHRRDSDRARRPVQRAERPRHSGPAAADAGRGIDPAGPRAAHRLRRHQRSAGLASSCC